MTSQSFASHVATSPTPAATWHYVYGIIRADDPLLFEVAGVDGAEDVYSVAEDGLAVVTSGLGRASLQGLGRAELMQQLSAHQRVLEAVQEDCAVLPVRFGTIVADQERLLALLRCGAGMLRDTIAAYADKRQFEVVVLWDLARVFEQIGAEPAIVALKAQIAARPAEESVEQRVILGQLVHAALQRQRSALSQELIAGLRDLADDLLVNPLMNDAMVANVALLLDVTNHEALSERLDALDAQYSGRLQFRCVGPLPAYSFATLDVQAPAFEAVDAARALLGLPEATSYAAVKRAYRSLAAQHHPDLNQHDEGAAQRMGAIVEAYKLLLAMAQAQLPDQIADDWPCAFDRGAVERTVLLAVTRQEGQAG